MGGKSHRAVARAIASLIDAEDLTAELVRGSTDPDQEDPRAHHAATDRGKNAKRQINDHIQKARQHLRASNRAEAAYALGIVLHYICDYLIPSGRRRKEHDRVERELGRLDMAKEVSICTRLTSTIPDRKDPLRALADLLHRPLPSRWQRIVLRDMLVCCVATSRAVFLPISSRRWWSDIVSTAYALGAGLVEEDERILSGLRLAYLTIQSNARSLQWWNLLGHVRTLLARRRLRSKEDAYVSRAALRRAHRRAEAELSEHVKQYQLWYEWPGIPAEVRVPEPQWVRVAELAEGLGLEPRRAEVMLAPFAKHEQERNLGKPWVHASMKTEVSQFLAQRLRDSALAGQAESLGGENLCIYCGYCGERIYFEHPGVDHEVELDCFNPACTRRYRY